MSASLRCRVEQITTTRTTMKVLILLPVLMTACLAVDNNDGQYHPDSSGQYVSAPGDDGRYYPDNSGAYIPDDSGRYIHDGTGAYAGQNEGQYKGTNTFITSPTFVRPVIAPQPTNVVPIIQPTIQPVQPPTIRTNVFGTDNYANGKWKIIRQLGDSDTDGYHWEYETENKIIAEESGKLHNKGTDAEALRAKGFFQYTGPDNVVYSVVYTADENGFVPVGAHLPTPPPIPAAIVKSLQYQGSNKL